MSYAHERLDQCGTRARGRRGLVPAEAGKDVAIDTVRRFSPFAGPMKTGTTVEHGLTSMLWVQPRWRVPVMTICGKPAWYIPIHEEEEF